LVVLGLALTGIAASRPAVAACSATNATVTQCDASVVNVVPNTGTSTLTVDGVSTVGILYTPGDSATGTYAQTLTLSGATVINNAGSSSISGGNGVTLKAALAHQDVTVIAQSGVSITARAGYGGGIWARSETAGNLLIDSSATVTVIGVDGSNNPLVGAADGITATTHLGSAVVINRGSVTSNGRGLYADSNYGSVTLNADYNVIAVSGAAAPASIINTGTVSATQVGARAIAYNGTASITNSGTITSDTRQAVVAWSDWGDASITNSGTAISNDRNVLVAQSAANGNATIINSGIVRASRAAVTEAATIGYSGLRAYTDQVGTVTLTNTASGTITANDDAAMVAHTPQGSIVVTNAGILTGLSGIFASSGSGTGTIDTISDTAATTATVNGTISASNSGTITAVNHGVYLDGTSASLTNSGTISAGQKAVILAGGAASVTNSGTITGSGSGIYSTATSAALTNTGVIRGGDYALYSSGTFGTVANSGSIQGAIRSGAGDLTITGGAGSTWGTFTGINGAKSTITAAGGSVLLASGNILLNDDVTLAAGGRLTNSANTRLTQALNVVGHYTQTASGSLALDVYSTTNYGRLLVSGAADLTNSSATLAPQSGFNLAVGQSYTIVNAASLSAAGFTAVTPGYANTVTTSANNLTVTIDSWTKKVALGNDGLGGALDTLAATSSTFRDLLTRIATLPVGEQRTAVAQLGNSQLTPQLNVGGTTVIPTTNAVQARQLALLKGGAGGLAGGDQAPGGNRVWGQFLAASGWRGTTSGADGYNSSTYGVMFGYDRDLTDDLSLGLAGSWLTSWARGKSASAHNTTSMDSYQLTGYGTWRPDAGPAFAEGLLGFGLNHYDQERGMPYLGLKAKADYLGTQYQVKVGGGYDLTLGRLKLTPSASLQYVHAWNDGYQEKNAGDYNLKVRSMSFDSVESELGAGASAGTTLPIGELTADFKASWVHSFLDAPLSTTATMGGVTFVASTDRPTKDGLRLSAGLDLQTSQQLTLRVEYDNETRRDFASHTGLFRARYEF